MPEPSSQQERSLQDRMISAGRNVWYALAERPRLQLARRSKWEDTGHVGVIIPTFNRRQLLCARALPSVLRQTHRNLTVCVVAHGCTDGTAQAVRLRGLRDKRVSVFTVKRRRRYPPTAENHWLVGPTDPLNLGLKVFRDGDGWIARLDDDDEWEPDHISRLLAFAREGDYEFVSSAALVSGKVPMPYRYPGGWVSTHGDPRLEPEGSLVGGCATWLYRSYLGFFRYNVDAWRKEWNRNNDTDLPERMCTAGVRMGYLPEITSKTEARPGENHVGSRAYVTDSGPVEERYRFVE